MNKHVRLIVPMILALSACTAASSPSATGSPFATDPASQEPSLSPSVEPIASLGPVPPGVILFHRRGSDGVEKYFSVNTDGTAETPLYEAEGCECGHLSADGTQALAIGQTRHGTWSLMTMNLDGTGKAVVDPPIATLNLFIGTSRADGEVLVFQGMDETDPARNGLWVASPTLEDARQILPLQEGWLALEPFGITPDGSKIVFFAETGAEGGSNHAGHIFVINVDGTGLRQLNPTDAEKPAYMGVPVISLSPDGLQAAFATDQAVYVADLETGDVAAITRRTGFVWAASWSPTGEWIVYTRFHGNTSVVSLVRPDGSEDHEISGLDEADEANAAVWSPDGQYLLAQRDHEGRSDSERDLWIMDLDGNWLGQVTNEPSEYGTFWWAPAPGG